MTDRLQPLSKRHCTGSPLTSAVTYIFVGDILALTARTGWILLLPWAYSGIWGNPCTNGHIHYSSCTDAFEG